MAENTSYGVYVSLRNTEGALWSSSRSEWVEVERDLDAAFGEGFAQAVVESLRRQFQDGQAEAKVIQLPVSAPSEEEALETVKQQLGATEDGDTGGQNQFETCNICGAIKDKWNPPGVSRSGKKYPGFFGCPNFRNHPKK